MYENKDTNEAREEQWRWWLVAMIEIGQCDIPVDDDNQEVGIFVLESDEARIVTIDEATGTHTYAKKEVASKQIFRKDWTPQMNIMWIRGELPHHPAGQSRLSQRPNGAPRVRLAEPGDPSYCEEIDWLISILGSNEIGVCKLQLIQLERMLRGVLKGPRL